MLTGLARQLDEGVALHHRGEIGSEREAGDVGVRSFASQQTVATSKPAIGRPMEYITVEVSKHETRT